MAGGEAGSELTAEDLVFEEQLLRLNVRGEHLCFPTVAGPDGTLRSGFGLNVCNEFGLWKRADLVDIGRDVNLTLVGLGAQSASLELLEGERADAGADSGLCLRLDEAARLSCQLRVDVAEQPVLLQAELVSQGARSVTGVCSLPIFPDAAAAAPTGDVATILRNAPEARQCRALRDLGLFVAEAPGHLGIGGKVWDAAFATLRWLAQGDRLQTWVAGRHLLELGSGTGALALALAASSTPASVTMTDLEEVVPLLDLNLALNRVMGASQGACPFQCAPLRWGVSQHARALLDTGYVPETLLLSDSVYDPACYAPLVETLRELCPPALSSRQQVLLIYRPRHCAKAFFGSLEESFQVSRLPGMDEGDGAEDLQFFSCVRRAS